MIETHPEKRLIGCARVSTDGQTLEAGRVEVQARIVGSTGADLADLHKARRECEGGLNAKRSV
jgi:hypothetical protein